MEIKDINVLLYECQIDVILKSLEVYCYDVNEKYHNRKMSKSKAEDHEKYIIKDTYHQLLACKNKFKEFEKISYEKIS